MSVSEKEIKQSIKESGKTGRRVTPQLIDARIESAECLRYVAPDGPTALTLCVMRMKNGFFFIGHSAAASPENYVKDVGDRLATEDARRQVWSHEGYLLKEELHREAMGYKPE